MEKPNDPDEQAFFDGALISAIGGSALGDASGTSAQQIAKRGKEIAQLALEARREVKKGT